VRRKKRCFCKENPINWKDLDTLKRFINDNGSIVARQKSGMCARCQRQLATAVKQARFAALLPYTTAHARFSRFQRKSS
jgi:small subunit ribosomal protein S18